MVNKPEKKFHGPIAWMASHPVAANLAMIVLIYGGLLMTKSIKQEVFPEFSLDNISINVPYPGASPDEVEKGIVLAVEEAVRGIDGVDRVSTIATEGNASVTIELISGFDPNKVLQDVKNAVDRITSLPEQAERPIVGLMEARLEVIQIVIYGDIGERELRMLAEQVRADLLSSDNITNVSMVGARPPEIHIEVPQQNLRAYNLTLEGVSNTIRRSAIEIPAGGVKTSAGEILLRTDERRDYGSDFHDIPIVTRPDGTSVRLGEIAQVRDGFRDTDESARYNGKPAIQLRVFRSGPQKPLIIADEVKNYVSEMKTRLPESVGIATFFDRSEQYRGRMDLLVRNAFAGLTLVFIVLGLFLEIRLSFWVMLGIPISILGSFLVFNNFDVSINMISLFAFIVSLGIVVDDAVVVGENIYEMRQKGYTYLEAAINGARSIAVPVTFSVITNMVAFAPMLFIPGSSGKFFRILPLITIAVFFISLIESLFILPAHLAHGRRAREDSYLGTLRRGQQRISRALQRFVEKTFAPALNFCIHHRYVTVAFCVGLLILSVALVAGGRVRFTYLPQIEADAIIANATLPFGSPPDETRRVLDQLEQNLNQVLSDLNGHQVTRGRLAMVGSNFGGGTGGHIGSVWLFLTPGEERTLSAAQIASAWRDRVGNIAGLENLRFVYETAVAPGMPLDVELIHPNMAVLEKAGADMALELAKFDGVKDIDDGFQDGKPQLNLKVRPEARLNGITAADLGSQVRNAFYGSRAFRQQRGRDEMWVMVRLPESERRSESDIGELLIRTPAGGEIPLAEAAEIERGASYTRIVRRNGNRVINVTADVDREKITAGQVVQSIQEDALPALAAKYPGLRFGFEGQQRDQREALAKLGQGYTIALIVIFAMLAIPLRSYVQPFMVMIAIPFGIFGAIMGHLFMGFAVSLISLMGVIALSGVVINDSLVLIHTVNEERRRGSSIFGSITNAAQRRFRPILLTSLTTFFGLMPMILESSMQARFLIPMAISLGFGIMFATGFILILVPCLYVMNADIQQLYAKIMGKPIESLEDPFEPATSV